MVSGSGAALFLCFFSLAAALSSSDTVGDYSIVFKIRWKDPLRAHEELAKEQTFESIQMISANSEVFVCYIPRKLQVTGDETNVKDYEGPTPLELLEPLFLNKVCRYKLESYWTYQLCYGRSLRQYHVEPKVATTEFYLGRSDPDIRNRDNEIYKQQWEESKKAGFIPSAANITLEGVEYPYFEMSMAYGNLCDITQEARSTQVYYICDQQSDHDIQSVEEISSCNYRVIVRTPLICDHPNYKVSVPSENELACHRQSRGTEASETAENADLGHSDLATVQPDYDVDLNQPVKLQEMERENREFRKTATIMPDEDRNGNNVKRNTKMVFLPGAEGGLTETPKQEENHVQRILSDNTCLTGKSGWWHYEFCYGKRLTQFHLEQGERIQEILLGKWDEAEHRKWMNADPSRKAPKNSLSVKHFYSNGDLCGVTGEPRAVEVTLRCKAIEGRPDAVSISLQEPKVCQYGLTVESQLVCKLLLTVDEDGLPQLPNLVNHHIPNRIGQDETKEKQEKSNENATALDSGVTVDDDPAD